jgi:hypothetical protein
MGVRIAMGVRGLCSSDVLVQAPSAVPLNRDHVRNYDGRSWVMFVRCTGTSAASRPYESRSPSELRWPFVGYVRPMYWSKRRQPCR